MAGKHPLEEFTFKRLKTRWVYKVVYNLTKLKLVA